MTAMPRPNPVPSVHERIAQLYLTSAERLFRLRDPSAELHALEHGVAAAEHAQYGTDQMLLDRSVALVREIQTALLRRMGHSGTELVAVPIAGGPARSNPRLPKRVKELDPRDEKAIQNAVKRAQAGSRSAFAQLYDLYYERMYRAALSCIAPGVGRKRAPTGQDIAAAQDIAQETFTRALERLSRPPGAKGQFRGDAKFSTWLHRIVTSVCKDWQRARGRAAEHREEMKLIELLPSKPTRPELKATRVATVFAEVLNELPKKQRQLIIMADMQGLRAREIAEQMRLANKQAAADALMDARKMLQKTLHAKLAPTAAPTPAEIARMEPAEQTRLVKQLLEEQQALLQRLEPKKNPGRRRPRNSPRRRRSLRHLLRI